MTFTITDHFYSNAPQELRRVEADYITTESSLMGTKVLFWKRSGKWWKLDRCIGYYQMGVHDAVGAIEGSAATEALERMYGK